MNFLRKIINCFRIIFNFIKASISWIKENSDRLLLNKKSPIGIKIKYVLGFPIYLAVLAFLDYTTINILSYIRDKIILYYADNSLTIFLKNNALTNFVHLGFVILALIGFFYFFVNIVDSLKKKDV